MTDDLAAEISRWAVEFALDHPRNEYRTSPGAQRSNNSINPDLRREANQHRMRMAPFGWLVETTGLDYRVIYRIVSRETKWTTFRVADLILTAIGSYHKLATGAIPVVPNPQWSNEKYISYLEERGCI